MGADTEYVCDIRLLWGALEVGGSDGLFSFTYVGGDGPLRQSQVYNHTQLVARSGLTRDAFFVP